MDSIDKDIQFNKNLRKAEQISLQEPESEEIQACNNCRSLECAGCPHLKNMA